MKPTIYKYIFNEIWPTFFASLLVFIFIVLAARILNITEWVINHGVHPFRVIKMILYLLPGMILFALPAATLMAVFLAFLRLSSDNEIQAMKSSGISLYQMLPPVIAVSLGGLILAFLLGSVGAPGGHRAFKDLIYQIAHSKADLGIKERIFCEPFNDITFYVNSFSAKERTLKDVFLVDRRDPSLTNTIIAKEGRIISHPALKMMTVHFSDGTIFMVDKKLEGVRTIKFNTYDLNIDLQDIMPTLSSRKRAPKEMGFQELTEGLRRTQKGAIRHNEMVTELMERFSIPFAVFLMGVIGVPLGAQIRSGGRFLGIVLSLLVFLLYYLFLAGVRSIGETGTLSPAFGAWLPDLFLVVSCIFLLRRAARERSINIFDRVISLKTP
ncbi:MAG: LPS export ABC transporter permease LptF [Proteobacteria bacterium]|nr:LPS export ABC transporter permease LptF [Pseudomonadota bacterium]